MAEKKIGYAYAATSNEMDEQTRRLKAAGCSEVFTDLKKIGSHLSRPGLKTASAALQAGDTLMVCDVKRLPRSTGDTLRLVDDLMSRGIEFETIDEPQAARTLQHMVNYAPDPSPDTSPIRYAVFRLGQFLVRHSRLGSSV